MFDTICSLPLPSDLLTQAIHPTIPLVAVGLASGHVQAYKLPPTAESSSEETSPSPDTTEPPAQPSPLKRRRRSSVASENGLGEIETAWRTRRHKGSCRCLRFGADGRQVFSAGTDGLVKIAGAEDGRVETKIAIPRIAGKPDPPSLLHPLDPNTLLLATDSSALYLYDLRTPASSTRPSQIYRPHSDFISSITPLPGKLPNAQSRQFLTTGSTTVAITDIRKGVISTSEEQQDELTASLVIEDSTGSKANQGQAVIADVGGSLSLWGQGSWEDHRERVLVDPSDEPLESIVQVPEVARGSFAGSNQVVAVGQADGYVKFVDLVKKLVVDMDVKHDDFEGVVGLGFDQVGRLVTGGGRVLKIWRGAEREGGEESASESAEEEHDDSSEEEPTRKKAEKKGGKKGKNKSGGNHGVVFNMD